MDAFLKQVARHYLGSGELKNLCFILPNRRSLVFFRKYLGECVRETGSPAIMPLMYTMNDFFYTIAGTNPADRVLLLLELHRCYSEAVKEARHSDGDAPLGLDDFITTGEVILSDFNDVDKYLVDPRKLFANVAEYREMQDNLEYLDETQREALSHFVNLFGTADSARPGQYQDKFLRMWNLLLPLYLKFNAALESGGTAYEGQVYRRLADRLGEEAVCDVVSEHFPSTSRYIFVGLNALNECEKVLMRRMRDARIAEFCWDYGKGWISDRSNKSSVFMSRNVEEFPQAFELDPEGYPATEFNVLSVPSATAQAKQLPEVLGKLRACGIETAVVLPDESLLLPVLNSIPENIRDINVTMGYPMSGSGLWALMKDIASLQIHMRQREDGRWCFYHEQVWSLMSNSIFRSLSSEEDRKLAMEIKKQAEIYVDEEKLSAAPLFKMIFRGAAPGISGPDAAAIRSIQDYQLSVIDALAQGLASGGDMAIELEFAKEYRQAILRLQSFGLEIRPSTYFRLLDALVGRSSVPFRGEPLNGLQIMGPLETRALDFDNVVILSCNEGIFPRRSVNSSIVPPELRKGFGLPTYEYQDAVWAYYFYRMIRRVSKVWMLYDSRTEGVRNGEESRYIKQLEMHFGVKLRRYTASPPLRVIKEDADEIRKSTEDVRKIREMTLSASSLQEYLDCQVKFYYSRILGLSRQDEVSEAMDAGQMGTIFHEVMRRLYEGMDGELTPEKLLSIVPGRGIPARIKDMVRAQIKSELKVPAITGKNLIYEDMICRYVCQTVRRDLDYMCGRNMESLRIIGLERPERMSFATENAGEFKFVARIDRIDSPEPGTLRIVDYKTGKVTDDDFIITEDRVENIVETVFDEALKDNAKRPKIALQLYLYDLMVSQSSEFRDKGYTFINSIYQTNRLFRKGVEEVPLNDRFTELMGQKLSGLLTRMADISVPFRRCADNGKNCEYCDFKTICGR